MIPFYQIDIPPKNIFQTKEIRKTFQKFYYSVLHIIIEGIQLIPKGLYPDFPKVSVHSFKNRVSL